jgi:hypothetical protein
VVQSDEPKGFLLRCWCWIRCRALNRHDKRVVVAERYGLLHIHLFCDDCETTLFRVMVQMTPDKEQMH